MFHKAAWVYKLRNALIEKKKKGFLKLVISFNQNLQIWLWLQSFIKKKNVAICIKIVR